MKNHESILGVNLIDVVGHLQEHLQAAADAVECATVSMYEGFLCQVLQRSPDKRKRRLEDYTAKLSTETKKNWRNLVQGDLKTLVEEVLNV